MTDRNDLESQLNESLLSESPLNESQLNESLLSESPLNESPLNESQLNESPLNESLLNESLIDYVNSAPARASRRTPLQPRSIQTIQRVADAASSLLGRVPLEDVTTTRIAVEAGISIGALYRFFPDKQSIIDAVAVRHVGEFRRLLERGVMPQLEREMQNLNDFQPARMLNLVVDAYVAYLDQHPDFRAISFGRHISAATKEREASPAVGLPAMLKSFMLERLRIPNTPELDMALRVVSEAGERLIAFAYEQPTRDERDRVVGEMKRMLAGYLFPGG